MIRYLHAVLFFSIKHAYFYSESKLNLYLTIGYLSRWLVIEMYPSLIDLLDLIPIDSRMIL